MGKYRPLSARMLVVVLACALSLAAVGQQQDDPGWLDPYDMLNYDASTKTMKKPAETANYENVATKRREYTRDQAERGLCETKVEGLQREIEEQKKKVQLISQQPTCNPVFKRFLRRLLKEIERLGLPSDSADVLYDAKVKLSRQSMTEIQMLLEGEDSWRTGALDNAISQILVDLKPHDHEAWIWRFEDTFGVELDTVLKVGLFVLVLVAIICTQLWSTISWFMQFKRLFVVCFFVSIVWNWFYLYKIAFAEHQSNIVKMDSFNDKCTGVKKIDWRDSLKEWFRSTWTLQDDPCKRYYEVLMVNPILLVPPSKAIAVTITTFITEPMKHLGQGISDFLRALLKDLPITLQIPVLLTIVLAIVVFMYGSVQAAFQHGITAPFRRPHRGPPHPELEQQQPQVQRIQGLEDLAVGDAPRQAPGQRADNGGQVRQRQRVVNGGQVRHRQQVEQCKRSMEEPPQLRVETLQAANSVYSEDEMDAQQREGRAKAEKDSDNQQEVREEPAEASAGSVEAKSVPAKTKPTLSAKPEKRSQDEPGRDDAALSSPPAGRRPAQTDAQVDEDRTSSVSQRNIETVGVPVQETDPAAAE